MKKISLAILIAVLLMSVWLMFGCESKGPKLVVENNSFNFGTAEQNGAVNHVFILRNEGDEDAQIKRVRSGCGCTVAESGTKVIKPGGQTEVKVTFNVGGRRGHQKKQITVESNDPVNPRLYLYLEGDILERLVFEPRSLRLVDLEPGQKTTGEVKITNKGQEPITINELKFDDPVILEAVFKGAQEVKLPYKLATNETVTLVLTVQMPTDKDSYRASVKLVTAERPDQPDTITLVMRKKGVAEKIKKMKMKKMQKKKAAKKKAKKKPQQPAEE